MWHAIVMALQLSAILAAALCGAYAQRETVELLYFNHTPAIVGGCAAAAGLLLLHALKNVEHAGAARWLGHSVLCTGGVAVVAAWAGAICDPLVRVLESHSLMPRSLVGFELVIIEGVQQCDIGTAYAAAGRRAVVACCSITAFAFAAAHHRGTTSTQQVVMAAVALAGLFATIVCNEDEWDWRALYAIAIALAVASFFANGAFGINPNDHRIDYSVAMGWGYLFDALLHNAYCLGP